MKNNSLSKSTIAVIALTLVAVLTACAAPQSTPAPQAAVTGNLTFTAKNPLPADAVAQVDLLDITANQAGEPQVIGSQQITVGSQNSPLAFEVKYDASKINAEHTYGISAKIVKGSDEYFVTTQPKPVITQGNPVKGVEVALAGAGSEAP